MSYQIGPSTAAVALANPWSVVPSLGNLDAYISAANRLPMLTLEEEQAFKQPIMDKFEHESSAYFSTGRLWDDGIIDTADTRTVLGHALAIARRVGCNPPNETQFGVFRM